MTCFSRLQLITIVTLLSRLIVDKLRQIFIPAFLEQR